MDSHFWNQIVCAILKYDSYSKTVFCDISKNLLQLSQWTVHMKYHTKYCNKAEYAKKKSAYEKIPPFLKEIERTNVTNNVVTSTLTTSVLYNAAYI